MVTDKEKAEAIVLDVLYRALAAIAATRGAADEKDNT